MSDDGTKFALILVALIAIIGVFAAGAIFHLGWNLVG